MLSWITSALLLSGKFLFSFFPFYFVLTFLYGVDNRGMGLLIHYAGTGYGEAWVPASWLQLAGLIVSYLFIYFLILLSWQIVILIFCLITHICRFCCSALLCTMVQSSLSRMWNMNLWLLMTMDMVVHKVKLMALLRLNCPWHLHHCLGMSSLLDYFANVVEVLPCFLFDCVRSPLIYKQLREAAARDPETEMIGKQNANNRYYQSTGPVNGKNRSNEV